MYGQEQALPCIPLPFPSLLSHSKKIVSQNPTHFPQILSPANHPPLILTKCCSPSPLLHSKTLLSQNPTHFPQILSPANHPPFILTNVAPPYPYLAPKHFSRKIRHIFPKFSRLATATHFFSPSPLPHFQKIMLHFQNSRKVYPSILA